MPTKAFKYCGIPLEHPICAAGGYCKTLEQVRLVANSASSLVEVGSVVLMPEKRLGNRGQTYWSDQRTVSYNSLGIPCPNEAYYRKHLPTMAQIAHDAGKPFVWNIAGSTPEDFARGAELGAESGADVLLANLGCPNLWTEGMQKPIISHNPFAVLGILRVITKAVGKSIPIDVKISPITHLPARKRNVKDLWDCIGEFPSVRAITAINSVPNQLGRDDSGQPCIISPDVPSGQGGMGGRIIKPLALWYVAELTRLAWQSNITIRACGGVANGFDVADFIGVGGGLNGRVVAVQVGTAVHDFGLYTPHHKIGLALKPNNEYENKVSLKYVIRSSVASSIFSMNWLCVHCDRPCFQTCS